MKNYLNHQEAKNNTAILAGLIDQEHTEVQLNEFLDELAFLAETAGISAIKRFTQRLPHPEPSTFLGKGKLN